MRRFTARVSVHRLLRRRRRRRRRRGKVLRRCCCIMYPAAVGVATTFSRIFSLSLKVLGI